METKSPRRIKALKILAKTPEGMFALEMTNILGYTTSKECGKMLNQLVLQGKLKTVKEGTQQASKRVRYFDPAHEATALAKNAAGKGKTWGLGKEWERKRDMRASGFTVKPKALKTVGDMIITDRTKITIAKTPLSRFHVENVHQHFSARDESGHMKPLDSTGSAIERAYL